MQITVTSEKESTHEAYAHWGRFGQERVSTTVWIVMNSPSGGSVYPVIAGFKRCLRRSSLTVRSAWKVVEVRTTGAAATGTRISVMLIAPQFVKPYVKSNKNDANDAECWC
jgi:hypothetical protein